MSRPPSSRSSPLWALLLAAACGHRGVAAGDAGPSPVVLSTSGSDSGAAGPTDAGGSSDAGPLHFDAGQPVQVRITQIAPDRGPVQGGTPVTIAGGGFLSGQVTNPTVAATVTAVSFGGNPAIGVNVLTDGTLQVSAPPGVPGPADVTIENPNGRATCAGCFTYLATLEVDQISPVRGPLSGGTSVTLAGIGFTPQTTLLFGPHAGIHTTFVSSTTMTCLTPPGTLAGPVDVRAFNGSGATLLHGAFTYFARPALSGVTPAGGPMSGDTPLILSGSGFLGEALAVTIGGRPATGVSVVDDQTATLVAPPGAAGPADVVATDADGADTLAGGYVYYPADVSSTSVLGVAPARGPAAGGTPVTVVGTGFSATPQVTFGGAPAGTVGLLDSHRIAVTTPPGAAGPVTVTVTDGSSSASLANGFTYFAGLTLTAVAPAEGSTAGGTTVTLAGSGFAPGDRVRIGPLPATSIQVAGPGTIEATTPPGTAGPADVRVISGADPSLFAILPRAFTYSDDFRLIQVAPGSGAQAGGTYVTLLGSGFGLGVGATFGGNPASGVQLVDPYTIACHTPPGAPGPVDVTATRGGLDGGATETGTLPGGFSYFDPTNIAGGESGGPLDGTLNVTVLDSDATASGRPLQGASVRLGVDPRTPFQGLTDQNGQITFSDPSLVKAQTVTANYEGVAAATIDGVASQNLTLFLDVPMGGGGNMPSPCPCGAPPDCPKDCGLPYCGAMGFCVQCLADSDCKNPAIPGYDPKKPKCNPPGGFGGGCVQCLADSDCAAYPATPACDDQRGPASSFSCVQCTSDSFCTGTAYCNLQSLTCVPADTISGAVYGFKLPPSVTLSSSQHTEARVGLLEPYVYAFEPFAPAPATVTVASDGGKFSIALDMGATTLGLYAKFGVVDTGVNPPSFTPLLLGVVRGLHVDPQHPVTGADIILDTHLDQTAPIQTLNTLSAPAPLPGETNTNPVHYDTFAYLDLGQDGILPLQDVDATTAAASLASLPPVSGNGVLFLTQAYQPQPPTAAAPTPDASQRAPASFFFRRVNGDFTAGVDVGPLLSFVNPVHPPFGGQLDGTFSWAFADPSAPLPDLTMVTLYWLLVDPTTGSQLSPLQQIWQIVVPGSETSVSVPPDELSTLLQSLPPSTPTTETIVAWFIQTARSPRFDYNFWSYEELSELTWTSFTSAYSLDPP